MFAIGRQLLCYILGTKPSGCTNKEVATRLEVNICSHQMCHFAAVIKFCVYNFFFSLGDSVDPEGWSPRGPRGLPRSSAHDAVLGQESKEET